MWMMHSLLVVMGALLLVCGLVGEAKEALPPFAYLNRSMYPTLVLYKVDPQQRHPSEQQRLQLIASIQRLEQRRDYLESLFPGALTAPPGPRPTKPDVSPEEAVKEAPLLTSRVAALRSVLFERYPDPYTHIPQKSHVEFKNLTGLSEEDTHLVASQAPTERPLLSMAIISDVQYADREEVKRRHFKLSLPKLKHAVEEIGGNWSGHVDVVLNLGDLVDADIDTNLPIVEPVLKELKQPILHVLGNHDFLGVNEADYHTVHKKLGMPSRYYSMRISVPVETKPDDEHHSLLSFRMIVLDGNDLAVYSTPVGSDKRRRAEGMYNVLKKRRTKNAQLFNGALDNPQLVWLKHQLYEACNLGERVMMLLHHPLRPRGDPTNLWNDDDVVSLIAQVADESNRNNTDGELAQCVLGVLNGHAHKYLYDFHHSAMEPAIAKARPVHFITVGGMVQSPFTSWGFVDVFHSSIRVHGLVFGRPIDFSYPIGGGLQVKGIRRGRASVALVSAPEEGTVPYPPELTKFLTSRLGTVQPVTGKNGGPAHTSGGAEADDYDKYVDLELDEDLHGYWHRPSGPSSHVDANTSSDFFWSYGLPVVATIPLGVLGYRCWRANRRRRVAHPTIGRR